MKVDFFVAGTQKGGTTALDVYLRRHPALQMASRKELHHFDNEALDWSHPDHSALHAAFDWTVSGAVRGECTPIYSFWPPSLSRIRNYNPKSRLIFLFRDPIERAYSHWRMEVTRNAETLGFSDAIRDGGNRLDPAHPPAPVWRVAPYVEPGLYSAQVRRALNLFPRDQMLFLRADDLSGAPEKTLKLIAEFLDVAPFDVVDPVTEHVGSDAFGPPSDLDIAYLRGMYRDDLLEFSDLTGLEISGWLTMKREAMKE